VRARGADTGTQDEHPPDAGGHGAEAAVEAQDRLAQAALTDGRACARDAGAVRRRTGPRPGALS
jgi:hypothetical protein